MYNVLIVYRFSIGEANEEQRIEEIIYGINCGRVVLYCSKWNTGNLSIR